MSVEKDATRRCILSEVRRAVEGLVGVSGALPLVSPSAAARASTDAGSATWCIEESTPLRSTTEPWEIVRLMPPGGECGAASGGGHEPRSRWLRIADWARRSAWLHSRSRLDVVSSSSRESMRAMSSRLRPLCTPFCSASVVQRHTRADAAGRPASVIARASAMGSRRPMYSMASSERGALICGQDSQHQLYQTTSGRLGSTRP
mmetsp:Transcript_18250/g.46727  ORF Transcript_18250/g.46727 Transcript_18250/m.46727 type:complete len:204 (+) Transcript_18250:1324-1935(+)